MLVHKTSVPIVTDSSEDAEVYLETGGVYGHLLSIRYYPGTIATGGDLVITLEDSGTPILTVTNAGTSNISWYPRAIANAVANAAAITDSREYIPISRERIKVVVDEGGATKTGLIEATYLGY